MKRFHILLSLPAGERQLGYGVQFPDGIVIYRDKAEVGGEDGMSAHAGLAALGLYVAERLPDALCGGLRILFLDGERTLPAPLRLYAPEIYADTHMQLPA